MPVVKINSSQELKNPVVTLDFNGIEFLAGGAVSSRDWKQQIITMTADNPNGISSQSITRLKGNADASWHVSPMAGRWYAKTKNASVSVTVKADNAASYRKTFPIVIK